MKSAVIRMADYSTFAQTIAKYIDHIADSDNMKPALISLASDLFDVFDRSLIKENIEEINSRS